MRKRAAVSEHTILNIIGVVLVVIVLVVIVPVVYRIIFPSPGGPERTRLVSLESLQEVVLETLANPSNVVVARNHPLFIESSVLTYGFTASTLDYAIIAFNPGDKEVSLNCVREIANRPKECPEDNACLCLYGFLGTHTKKPPVACKTIAGNVVFLAPAISVDGFKEWNFGTSTGSASVIAVNNAGEGPFPGFVYANLVLYGRCRGSEWNTQPVYVEKFVDGETTFVYVAREGESTNARFNAVKNKWNVVVV